MSVKVTRKWLRLRLLVGVLVVLGALLFAGYEVVIHNVQPDAVRISHYMHATGRVLAERTITDPRTVADDYARINSIPAVPPDQVWHCGLADLTTVADYSVIFFYRGIDMEDATFTPYECYIWRISRGPLNPLVAYFDAADVAKPVLAQVQA